MGWTTQAIGQQHTSPLRARCETRHREVAVVCGCGNGLARDAPGASKADGGLRAGGPQGLQAKPRGNTGPRANHRPRVDDGRDPAKVLCMQPLEGVDLEGHAVKNRKGTPRASFDRPVFFCEYQNISEQINFDPYTRSFPDRKFQPRKTPFLLSFGIGGIFCIVYSIILYPSTFFLEYLAFFGEASEAI